MESLLPSEDQEVLRNFDEGGGGSILRVFFYWRGGEG